MTSAVMGLTYLLFGCFARITRVEPWGFVNGKYIGQLTGGG